MRTWSISLHFSTFSILELGLQFQAFVKFLPAMPCTAAMNPHISYMCCLFDLSFQNISLYCSPAQNLLGGVRGCVCLRRLFKALGLYTVLYQGVWYEETVRRCSLTCDGL